MNQSEQLSLIDSRSLAVRALLMIAVIAAVAAAVYGASWQFGRALAETFSPSAAHAAQTAQLAVRLAPEDSQTHLIAGQAGSGAFFADAGRSRAREQFEQAARDSPNDYRFWLELGRAREQSGDRAGGETALRRAVELAPNYAYPRWFLGNLLLRDNRREEAFAEFQKAAHRHSIVRQQVFRLIWQATDGDAQTFRQMFGDTAQVRAALAAFYAGKNLPNESITMWQSLTEADKSDNRSAGELAMQINFDNYNYSAAAFLAQDLELEAVEVGRISNPGFENEILPAESTHFGWKLSELKNVSVSIDLRGAREGNRSLHIIFNGYSEPTLQYAQQIVVIEPNQRYRLTFAVRTTDLKSAGMPFLEVIHAKSSKSLGATAPFAAGTTNWQTAAVDFTAPTDATGVILRTVRTACGSNCPLVGSIWYDDFKLERVNK